MGEILKTSTIHTTRLILRPTSLDDAQALYEIRTFPEVYQWTMSGQWNDISQSETWISQHISQPDTLQFTIELPSDSTEKPTPGIIGAIGTLVFPEPEPDQDVLREIGFMLHPRAWGKGYASEALQGLIKAIFEKNNGWIHLIARADEGNRASNRVLEKSGFKKVERIEYENKTLGKRALLKYELARPEPTPG